MLLNPEIERLSKYVIANRMHWRFMMEGNIIRIVTNQQILAWEFVKELEKKFNLEVFEISNTPTYGMVISFNVLS